MTISPARIAAFESLQSIDSGRAFSSVLLPAAAEKLGRADRGLCYELVLGTLRRRMLLDRQIDYFSSNRKLDPEVRNALRIGLYQLQFLDRIPAYSAINESVELAARAGKGSAKSLVNAILRRSTRETPPLQFADAVERISVESSHPAWLIEKWTRDHGPTEAHAIASSNNDIPATAFRLIGEPGPEALAVVADSVESDLIAGCFIARTSDDRLAKLSSRGEIYVQDEASQLVGSLIAVPDGGRFLDVCASPGGKTGLVGTQHPLALLFAGDFSRSRVELLTETCRRQGLLSVNVLRYDATVALPFAAESFDAILVDAPCSGTGTIRHNPEIRYSIEPADLPRLASKQLSMLKNASKLLKRDGLMIYSTCSLEPEENEFVCNAFLAESAGFCPVSPLVPERFITPDGFARTFPHRDRMDGFFIGGFRRTE